MLFNVDTTWLITMVLVTIRLGVLFYATPFDAIGKLPVQIRVLTTFILAAMLTSFLDLSSSVMPTSIPALVAFGIHELIVGLVMAFGLYCVFGSIMVAGKLIDFQAGFGAAQILNPSTNAASPLIGTALSLFAVVLFFVSNAYQLAIRGIAWSLTVSPPGSALWDHYCCACRRHATANRYRYCSNGQVHAANECLFPVFTVEDRGGADTNRDRGPLFVASFRAAIFNQLSLLAASRMILIMDRTL